MRTSRPFVALGIASLLLGGLAGCQTPGQRASCSSLCQCKQPLDKALEEVSGMGFQYVDLSCLSWAPHASVPDLMKDFEAEASRVESALALRDWIRSGGFLPIGSG